MNILKKQRQSEIPAELNKYEDILSKYMWVIMLVLITADVITRSILGQVGLYRQVFLIQSIAFFVEICISIIRMFYIRKQQIKPGILYSVMKLLDILVITILLHTMYNGFTLSFLIIIPIISICITRGLYVSVPYLGFALVTHVYGWHLFSGYMEAIQPHIYTNKWFFYTHTVILFIVFFIFLSILRNYNLQFEQNENDNNNLVSQLGRKYAQLEEARLEKQEQYDELVKVNARLEETNVSLNSSLAEFFTLQQVSQAISSLFDMNELLGFVNDIIIGVMGASTSNIVLYKRNRLIVQITNIQNIRERAILTDNINNSFLRKVFENGEIIINNNVDPDNYEFTKGRNVKSLICVPLQVKDKIHGLLLIEHSIPEAFGDSNIRLLNIVAQQVSIAIENARLYEQLQDYANTDGLTQVYNRLFFQNYLSEELKKAKENGFEVSVIMYDIDNFKKFNDTYGHLFGDIVLKSISRLVKSSIRKNDIIARFGGEEFIILLPHTSAGAAYEKAEELRKSIESIVVQDKVTSASVTVSMGVSTFPDFADSEDSLLRSVDAALYEAKGKGKNRVEIAGS